MRKIPRVKLIRRDDWIVEFCRDKRVLHIGCTDYPITQSKIANGYLLHDKLNQVTQYLVGLDNDKEGIDTLSKAFQNSQFIVQNAEKLDECLEIRPDQDKFDVIVAADVIEHISNIGNFLKGLYSLLHGDNRVLITTPQAFAIKRFLPMIFWGYEYVHPDHIAYFSISTLSRLLSRYQLEIEEFYGFQWYNPTFKNRFANTLVAPALWLSGGRLCDELALVIKRQPQ
ncbi:class I SAM-dependent methyltransferase [Coleofasciculus sp. E1-EBD-02]|uniref:class I SAM-dependent methyltransferase n=1 Tax=Coleofasciculus sp. E1-EBD-02 TaxID=3068481 RepID=UPI0032F7F609